MNKEIVCDKCGKEIIFEDKEITNGFQLIYDVENDKKVSVFRCEECYEKDKSLANYQECEVYTRVVGYLRPIKQFNAGKQQEFEERKNFKIKNNK